MSLEALKEQVGPVMRAATCVRVCVSVAARTAGVPSPARPVCVGGVCMCVGGWGGGTLGGGCVACRDKALAWAEEAACRLPALWEGTRVCSLLLLLAAAAPKCGPVVWASPMYHLLDASLTSHVSRLFSC